MILTILIASLNVTLNSLRMLAWLSNFLLQACSGGAALSKSNWMEVQKNQLEQRIKLIISTQQHNRK